MFGIGQNKEQQPSQLGNISARQVHSAGVPEQVIKWRMDTKEDLEKIEAVLLGKVLNDEGVYKLPENKEHQLKICNEKGVAMARAWFVTLINRITLQGSMSEDEIEEQLLIHANTITENVGKEYKEYEIKKELRDTYIDLLVGMMRIALTRPIDDMERVHAVQQSSEKVNTSQVQSFRDQFPHYGQQPVKMN